MIIQVPMKLKKIETKSIANEGGKATTFKSASLVDNDENLFEVTLDKESSVYDKEGTIEKDGTATLDIFVEDKAKTSKAGNPYIAKVLKMRCMDFTFSK